MLILISKCGRLMVFLHNSTEPIETIKTHEMRLHEINTLEWDELLVPDDPNKLIPPEGGNELHVACIRAKSSQEIIDHFKFVHY